MTTLASAILSSGTNAGAVLSGASLLDATSYGVFSLAALVALFSALVINSFTGEVLLGIAPGEEDVARAYSATAALLLGLLVAIALFTLATRQSYDLQPQMVLVVAAATLAITAHALGRSVAFASHRPATALLLDIVWAVCLIIGLGFAIWLEIPLSEERLLLLWAAGAAVAVVSCPGRANLLSPRVGRVRYWWREHGGLGLSLAYGVVADSGARNAVIATVAPVSGLVALGGLRFAQTVLGLSTVFFTAARSRALPALARRSSDDPSFGRTLLGVSAVLALVPIGTGLFLLLLSPVLAGVVNSETWAVSRTLILPVALTFAFSAMIQGPLIGLRLLGAAGRLAGVRTAHGILLLVVGMVLLRQFGVEGAAWGLAIGNALGAILWWDVFRRARR